MKRTNRIWITSVCTIVCLLGAIHWFRTGPIYAQQNNEASGDGIIYVYAWIDVDANYNLYSDGYVEDVRTQTLRKRVVLAVYECVWS